MSMRKKWTSEEKMAVVLEGLKGAGLKAICTKYGISDNQYYKWREAALEGIKKSLGDKREKNNKTVSWESERDRLLKVIGEQKIIIDYQKKISDAFS